MFRDAGGGADDRRHAPAQRFAHGQAVRLVARRMDQRVEGRQDLRHVGPKTGEPNPIAEAGLARAAPPRGQLGALTHDDQIGVPFPAPAELAPRAEHRVERLSAIAERADEADQRPAGRLRQRRLGRRAFLAVHQRKANGVAAVINDAYARRIDANPLNHIVARPPAVADDDPCGAERRAFRREVAAMGERRLRAARGRAGARERIRRVQVVDPVDAGNPAVAAVDDGPRARRAQAPPHALSGPRQQRAAEQVPVERPPHAVDGDIRQRREIGPGAMRDEMDLVARRQDSAPARGSPRPCRRAASDRPRR